MSEKIKKIHVKQKNGVFKEYELDSTGTSISKNDNLTNIYTWNDFKNMCNMNSFSGIKVGDYVDINMGASHLWLTARIAGIDTYYNLQTDEHIVGHHIDFITDQLVIPTYFKTGNNNGTQDVPSPYLDSYLYRQLDELQFNSYLSEIYNHASDKYVFIERRYSQYSSSTKASNGCEGKNIGKFWVPSEFEVFGAIIYGTPENSSAGSAIQYELFRKGINYRRKFKYDTGNYEEWWLSTVRYNSNDEACIIDSHGIPSARKIDLNIYAPIGFRIESQ